MDRGNFDGLKKWKCDANESHVLGILKRVESKAQVDGQTIRYHTTQVILFRQAVDVDKEIPDDIDVAGYIEGSLLMNMTWQCTVCGTTKTWHPGEEALAWLYERHGKKEVRDGQADGRG
jgi:hypothetical protein